MFAPPLAALEARRLDSLQGLQILDTPVEPEFDALAEIASELCDAPMAWISFIDAKRQWLKARVGILNSEWARESSLCRQTILQQDVFVIGDMQQDVHGAMESGAHFYAAVPLLSPDGYAVGTLGVMDVTARTLSPKQHEALRSLALQVSRLLELRLQRQVNSNAKLSAATQAFWSAAVAHSAQGIVLQDRDGKILTANPSAIKILGVSADHYVGQSFDQSGWLEWKAVDEDGRRLSYDERPIRRSLQSGQTVVDVVMGLTKPNGEPCWIRVTSTPLFLEGPLSASHVVSSFLDITDERRSRQELEKSEANLRQIFNGVPAMIGTWSRDLINLNANNAYLRFFGKRPDEIQGRSMGELLGPELLKKNWPYIEQVLEGKTVTFEREIPTANGVRHTLATYIPKIENGAVVSFLAVVTDISVLKRLEENRRSMEAQLGESARLSALGEMASGMAHEINNPLAIISGKASILRGRLESGSINREAASKDLETIERTIERISKIIRGLKLYSRNAEGDPFEPTSLVAIIDDTMQFCSERIRNHGISLLIDCDPQAVFACRPGQISQVLMNLISNALDAVSDAREKWIRVAGRRDKDFVEFTVSDSGPGVPNEIVEKIMQPFFTTKEVGKGTGLGLSISKGIVETHNGTLTYKTLKTRPTVVVRIPIRHVGHESKAG